MARTKLLLASTSLGKLGELQDLVGEMLEVVSLRDFRNFPEVLEDGDSFETNARKKAVEYARWAKLPALADDSGLCVDALRGAPGIFSARYAPGDDSARIQKLLDEMAHVPLGQRGAAFACALCLSLPDGKEVTVTGKCFGTIAFSPRGRNGFGYDPVFLFPDGRSMAELGQDEKSRLSHRADAFRQMKSHLRHLVVEGGG